MIPLPTALFVSDLESLEEVIQLAAPVADAAERLRVVTEAAEIQKARKRCAHPLVAKNRSGLIEIQKEGTGRRRPWSRALVCEACREAPVEADPMDWPTDPWPNDQGWDRDWPWDNDYAEPAA